MMNNNAVIVPRRGKLYKSLALQLPNCVYILTNQRPKLLSQHNNYNLQHGTQFKNNSWPLNTLEAAGISNHQLGKSIPEKAKDSAGTLHRLTYQLPTGPQTSSGAKFQNYVSVAVCHIFFPARMKMALNETDKSEGGSFRAAIISHSDSVLCAADV